MKVVIGWRDDAADGNYEDDGDDSSDGVGDSGDDEDGVKMVIKVVTVIVMKIRRTTLGKKSLMILYLLKQFMHLVPANLFDGGMLSFAVARGFVHSHTYQVRTQHFHLVVLCLHQTTTFFFYRRLKVIL